MERKPDLRSLSLSELKDEIGHMGEKSFHAVQIYEWLHKKQAQSVDEMTNLSAALREQLKNSYDLYNLTEVKALEDCEDGTFKYLFATGDENVIESVFMSYEHGYSVCISSQVGCRMGCSFCASTIGGKVRDLTAEGYTVMMSTHNPEQAFLYADRVLVLCDGSLAGDGSPEQVLTGEMLQRIYGIPVLLAEENLGRRKVRICLPAE
jgi:hypothetical protein